MSPDPEAITRQFLEAFSAADFDRMRALLAPDARAYVTNAEGGVDEVAGADAYLARIAAMDLASADFTVTPTQVTTVAPDQVLIMAEVRARRRGRTLHNFAAHLLSIRAGRIEQLRMVEAKPAESAAFWSS